MADHGVCACWQLSYKWFPMTIPAEIPEDYSQSIRVKLNPQQLYPNGAKIDYTVTAFGIINASDFTDRQLGWLGSFLDDPANFTNTKNTTADAIRLNTEVLPPGNANTYSGQAVISAEDTSTSIQFNMTANTLKCDADDS